MYSGSDSTESQNYNQWPLNPSAFQNAPNDQIDWAALAQQWIIMKEAGPPVPEPPQISQPPVAVAAPLIKPKSKNDGLPEGGEAPMDVENDKEDDPSQPPHWNNGDGQNLSEGSWNWNQQWGWGNAWSAPSAIPPPGKGPLLPTPAAPFNQFTNSNDNATFPGASSSEYSGGYWTASGAKQMKPHNKRFSKVNVPPTTSRPVGTPPVPAPEPVALDANKRKQLPAWIREGLEKMERDKQKQLEKEKELQEQVEVAEKSKLNEKEALEIIKMTVKERERSKFESEDEDSNVSFQGNKSPSPLPRISHDELIRKTMTEVLLKVTNQEIRLVCKEEFQRHLRKIKASDQRVSASSGNNISGRLGLGIYGGDSGSSSENSDAESTHDSNYSDAELKDIIKRRKAEFSKTEREIESRLAAAERANEHNDASRGGTPAVDDNESQVDAKAQGHRIRSQDSDNNTLAKGDPRRSKRRHSSPSTLSSDSDSDYDDKRNSSGKNTTKKRSRHKSPSSESDYYDKKSSKYSRRRDSRSVSSDRTKSREKVARNSDKRSKPSESSSSKSSSSRSRRSRSKSADSAKRKKRNSKSYSRHSRSSSRSRRSPSYDKSRNSGRRRRRSKSRTKSDRYRKSNSRSRGSSGSKAHTRSTRSYRSRSRDRHSRSKQKSSRSSRKSNSYSISPKRGRSRSRSSSRSKRSRRY